MKAINIAIDGPSAAGKSSISNLLASELGYIHLDTGAMYRCVALKAIRNGIDFGDEAALLEMLKHTEIELTVDQKVLLDHEDVTSAIRENKISMGASTVSKLKGIRSELVSRQQAMAKAGGFIMDGRDIGTVVLKNAELKIFLTASAHARAERRFLQNQEIGVSTESLQSIEKEIEQRDYQDTHRANSPLVKAEDAIEIDSSDMSIAEVVEKIRSLISLKLEEGE